LADLAVLLSRIAIAQRVSAAVDEADPIALDIRKFATSLHPDVVQLFYTVAVHSRSELAIAPDEYAGFVMACLRMLSLGGSSGMAMPAPESTSQPMITPPSVSAAVAAAVLAPAPAPAAAVVAAQTAAPVQARPAVVTPPPAPAVTVAAPTPAATPAPASVAVSSVPAQSPESDSEPEPDDGFDFQDAGEHDEYSLSAADFERMHAAEDEEALGLNPATPAPILAPAPSLNQGTIVLPEPWAAFAAKLPLSGMSEQLARQSECVAIFKQQLTLRVPSKALSEGAPVERLRTVLNDYFGFKVELLFEIGAGEGSSAHALDLVAQQARQDAAEVAIDQDPFVQALIQDFGAKVVPGSIRPSQLS
jgi:DNA polymerase-3 subunit gamma/tau